ncbi:MAG: hypothetical protein R2844_15105 [Caldilineales bacterium]
MLLIYSLNDLLVVWDANSGEEIVNFRIMRTRFCGPIGSPDGSRIVSGGQDGKALIWDSATGEALYEFAGHAKDVNFVRWSPTNDQIVTASDDGTAKIWSLTAQMTAMEIPGTPVALGRLTGLPPVIVLPGTIWTVQYTYSTP